MKKQTSNKTQPGIKANAHAILLLLISGILLAAGCEKSQPTPNNQVPQLNAQEQALVGKWYLQRSEIYEITGQDSSGQYLGPLISSSVYDPNCKMELKKDYKGLGSFGNCDTSANFAWKAKQLNKLEIGPGNFYDLVYLTADSAAFSKFYIEDILKLKSVLYYKRYQ